MRQMRSWVVWVLAGMCFLPETALAQVIISQRCSIDSADTVQAEARLGWMRRCALAKGATGFNTGGTAPDGTPMWEYIEPGDAWLGTNMYTGSSGEGEINFSYVTKLYNSGLTYQNVDAAGFYRWYRDASRKKARPLYPTYGSTYDISNPGNVQLFPHPTLANCSLYYDRTGTQLATSSFYLNAFCEAVPAPVALSSGVPITVSGAMGSLQYYTLTVPPGIDSVIIQTSGGTGDVDLHVRFGAQPTETVFDCRPYLGGNLEGCNLPSPNAGTWYVMLKGLSAYSGVTLKATYFY